MCELMEKYTKNRIKEATKKVEKKAFAEKKRSASKLLNRGFSVEETAETMNLPLDVVLELNQKKSA